MRALLKEIEAVPTLIRYGRVARIEGLAVEVTGAVGAVSLGGQCRITIGNNKKIPCEVIGFRDGRALVMPLGSLDGITLGARADFEDSAPAIFPSKSWLGRVVDGFGAPMDGLGALPQGTTAYPLRAAPPAAIRRSRVGKKMDLVVRAMNAFTTLCEGQRMAWLVRPVDAAHGMVSVVLPDAVPSTLASEPSLLKPSVPWWMGFAPVMLDALPA